jgi:hypothetical protein
MELSQLTHDQVSVRLGLETIHSRMCIAVRRAGQMEGERPESTCRMRQQHGTKIIIFDLLTHTSGIPSFTGFPDYADSESETKAGRL